MRSPPCFTQLWVIRWKSSSWSPLKNPTFSAFALYQISRVAYKREATNPKSLQIGENKFCVLKKTSDPWRWFVLKNFFPFSVPLRPPTTFTHWFHWIRTKRLFNISLGFSVPGFPSYFFRRQAKFPPEEKRRLLRRSLNSHYFCVNEKNNF